METVPAQVAESTLKRRKLPHPVWMFLAAVMLVVLGAGLRVGLPVYRQYTAVTLIEERGASVPFDDEGPKWLRQ